MCGGFTFKGVQLQEDTVHEVTVTMMMMVKMVIMMMIMVAMTIMIMMIVVHNQVGSD